MKLNLIIAQELNRYQGKIKFLIPEKCVPADKTPNLRKNMLRICFISAEFFPVFWGGCSKLKFQSDSIFALF